MNRKYEVKSRQTLDVISGLLDRGITRIAAIIRHSDRFYAKTAQMEAFMGLTPAGREYAVEMGEALPADPVPRLFSSLFGRCIETAYLIDKGWTRRHGAVLAHNEPHELLAPFYIKDIHQAIPLVEAQGTQTFIRNWFDRKINGSIMEDPEKTAHILTDFMAARVRELAQGEIAVCVSHDWNIFPLKEYILGVPHETDGDVGYLDGVVYYEADGRMFITASGADPRPLN